MIQITSSGGRVYFLSADAIAKISEAGPSSQWHGIMCYVKCFDGSVIESRDDAAQIAAAVKAEGAAK